MEDYLDGLEEATFARAQLHYGAQVGLDWRLKPIYNFLFSQLRQLGLLVLLQRAGAEASPAPPSPTSTPGCSLSTAQARQCIWHGINSIIFSLVSLVQFFGFFDVRLYDSESKWWLNSFFSSILQNVSALGCWPQRCQSGKIINSKAYSSMKINFSQDYDILGNLFSFDCIRVKESTSKPLVWLRPPPPHPWIKTLLFLLVWPFCKGTNLHPNRMQQIIEIVLLYANYTLKIYIKCKLFLNWPCPLPPPISPKKS